MSDLFKQYEEFLPDPTPSRCPQDGITVSLRRRKNSSRGRPALVFTLGPDVLFRWLGTRQCEASVKVLWASGPARGRVALLSLPATFLGWRLRSSGLGTTSCIYISNYPKDANTDIARQHDRCTVVDVLHEAGSPPTLILELPPDFYHPVQPLIDLAQGHAPSSTPSPAPSPPAAPRTIASKADGLRALSNFAQNRKGRE